MLGKGSQICLVFCNLIIINNYLTRKLREFYLTEGSQDQFGLQNIPNAARSVLQVKLVEGTQGKVNFTHKVKSTPI